MWEMCVSEFMMGLGCMFSIRHKRRRSRARYYAGKRVTPHASRGSRYAGWDCKAHKEYRYHDSISHISQNRESAILARFVSCPLLQKTKLASFETWLGLMTSLARYLPWTAASPPTAHLPGAQLSAASIDCLRQNIPKVDTKTEHLQDQYDVQTQC